MANEAQAITGIIVCFIVLTALFYVVIAAIEWATSTSILVLISEASLSPIITWLIERAWLAVGATIGIILILTLAVVLDE